MAIVASREHLNKLAIVAPRKPEQKQMTVVAPRDIQKIKGDSDP